MNHDIPHGRLQQSETTPLMYLGSQRRLKRKLLNMHGQQSCASDIMFDTCSGLLLIRQPCSRHATASPWPTETGFVVDVGHCDGPLQACTPKQIHRGTATLAYGKTYVGRAGNMR